MVKSEKLEILFGTKFAELLPDMEFHVSSDVLKKFGWRDVYGVSADGAENWLAESLHARFIEALIQDRGLPPRLGVLLAHGGSESLEWVYIDGNRVHTVQNWIKHNDGRFGLILLLCCNQEVHGVSSESTPILVSNSALGGYTADFNAPLGQQCDLWVPGKGWLDNYTIEYETEKLRQSIKS